MLASDPSLIEAKGMDEWTPYCSATVQVATLPLEHGARIDALDGSQFDAGPVADWGIA
jgi:hypothetical protein